MTEFLSKCDDSQKTSLFRCFNTRTFSRVERPRTSESLFIGLWPEEAAAGPQARLTVEGRSRVNNTQQRTATCRIFIVFKIMTPAQALSPYLLHCDGPHSRVSA